MTKLTDLERMVLAVYLGGTNMGFMPLSRKEIQSYLDGTRTHLRRCEWSVQSLTHSMWGNLAESDEMLEGFEEETQDWYKDLGKKMWTREKLIQTWPDLRARFW
jgi:hypothetical protein